MFGLIRFLAYAIMSLTFFGLMGCSTPTTRLISAEPSFTGKTAPQRVMVYNFIDWELSYTTDRFRSMVQKRLQEAFLAWGVKNEQLWYCDTQESAVLRADKKNHTLGNSTFVDVGSTIKKHIAYEYNIQATHRIIIFPIETSMRGKVANINVKWEVFSTQTGYLDWSAYSHTTGLKKDMSIEESDGAAQSFVDTMIATMTSKKVFDDNPKH